VILLTFRDKIPIILTKPELSRSKILVYLIVMKHFFRNNLLRNQIISIIFVFFSFFLNFTPTIAQNALNEAEIENYLATLPLIEAIVSEENANLSIEETDITRSGISLTPITDSLELARHQPTYPKFLKIIENAQFNSPSHWANVGDNIMMAYSAFHLKSQETTGASNIEAIIKDLTEKLANIEKNQFISSDQKQLLIEKIQNSMALISDPNYINSENISIISPYIDRLNSLFKDYQ